MVAKVTPLLVIVGETASGKSDLAMQIAHQFNGEIICADSRTIYKGMDIGTAKPSKQDQTDIRHHLLDIAEPGERYSAGQFKLDALRAINNVSSRDKLPILVGGSGLYIDSVLYDYQFSQGGDNRSAVNPRHLDKTVSQKKGQPLENVIVVGLSVPRSELSKRIISRADEMISSGLLDEVKYLLDSCPNSRVLDAPGYRSFKMYAKGEITLDEARALLIKNSLQLAKRQKTWFKRNQEINWFEDRSEVLSFVSDRLNDLSS